ncbi:MAG: methylated-DNA--[protein]-cysteine S-methyltransferase [Actinobacteria bacterium]|nr:methylated-DNA--[protein]-cysteine S-methyltransferase [Actinomycetota bacterium]
MSNEGHVAIDEPALVEALTRLREPAPAAVLDRIGAALEVGDRFVVVDSPLGRLYVAFNDRGISMLETGDDEAGFRRAFSARWPGRPLRSASRAPAGLAQALQSGRSPASLRYDLSGLSPFQQAVLRKTAEIPPGEVRPYAWVAREVGQPAAVRAVGTALGRNPVPVLIPCHRVVRSDGRIGNYALGTPMKERLLTVEGVNLPELHRLAGSGVRYVGSTSTSIFCLPTCHAARRIGKDNVQTFRSAAEASRAGYRPCQKCRPAEIAA